MVYIATIGGNIFNIGAEALVNPVNCYGVMGAGLAKQFKINYPSNFKAYNSVCTKGQLNPGSIFTFREGNTLLFNFPTKDHWRDPSKMEYVSKGLDSLVKEINIYAPKSIAIPALGCGLGGLHWLFVETEIRNKLTAGINYNADIFLFPPQ